MDPIPLGKIAEFAGATSPPDTADLLVSNISTDSRSIAVGDLFVALRGENFDAHNFLPQVAGAGAAAAIVAADWEAPGSFDLPLIRVADTLAAYQQIAAGYRNSLGKLKVIAITGSNGKTSTKDFVAGVLSRRLAVTSTVGNLNNHIGLPRTMLEAAAGHDIAVWEIGMNHPGEIAPLAQLASPDVAIITNIGIAHIEFMGSREAIALEKGALAEALSPEGTLILNADDEFSASIAARTRANVVFAGIEHGTLRAADVRQSGSGSEFTLLEGPHRCRATLPVPGQHMVQNALLAVAAGRVFGLSLEDCAAGLAAASLTKARLQIKTIHGCRFIDDSYNANPDSMKAALRTLAELETEGRRIAVLGGMSELGTEAAQGHREVGEAAARLNIDQLIAIGELGAEIARAARDAGLENSTTVGSAAEAAELLAHAAGAGDLVLIKGSRSARTERVLEEFSRMEPAGVRS